MQWQNTKSVLFLTDMNNYFTLSWAGQAEWIHSGMVHIYMPLWRFPVNAEPKTTSWCLLGLWPTATAGLWLKHIGKMTVDLKFHPVVCTVILWCNLSFSSFLPVLPEGNGDATSSICLHLESRLSHEEEVATSKVSPKQKTELCTCCFTNRSTLTVHRGKFVA